MQGAATTESPGRPSLRHLLSDRSIPAMLGLGFSSGIPFLLVALGVLALLWAAPTVSGWVSAIDLSEVDHLYAIIAGFVTLDAVLPVFPSESLLTTAANLAAQDGSTISLWRLIAAGTVGAVVGGLTLGVLINVLGTYVDFIGGELRLPAALTVLLLVLLIRPQGLFGHRVVRRV